MSVKGTTQKKEFPLPAGVAKIWAARISEATKIPEDRKGNKTYIFEKVGGMAEIGITSLDPPAGWMKK